MTVRGALLLLALAGGQAAHRPASGQGVRRWLPDRALMPDLIAGPRDPVSKGQMLLVTDDPSAFGDGAAAEVALGVALPVYLLAGRSPRDGLVFGLEAAVFARFTAQISEKELIATDWVFALPLVWRRNDHWVRWRYYHTSSHLGDEYGLRFDVDGVNFARDAIDALGYLGILPGFGAYGGVGWAYIVHPEASRRWWWRAGVQSAAPEGEGGWHPYLTADVQSEQDNGWAPRIAVQAGIWLPSVAGRRSLRFGFEFLDGPSPLGQFQGRHTTHLGLGMFGNF